MDKHMTASSILYRFFDSIGLLALLASPISLPLFLLYECHRIGKRAAYTYAFFCRLFAQRFNRINLSQAFSNDFEKNLKKK
jgi:hypothetical protein